MKQKLQKHTFIAILLFALFLAWTAAVCLVDVQSIGPNGSPVGFAALNQSFHKLTGVHWKLYDITDLLGILPFLFVAAFAAIGLMQLIQRKNFFQVDSDIIILGIFYIAVLAFYLLFELVEINYRPVLVENRLEASYPSSTTMLALCVFPTAILQLRRFIRNNALYSAVSTVLILLTLFMVIGRAVSGVHWLSDIIGGILLSASLVLGYSCGIAFLKLNTGKRGKADRPSAQ